MNRNAAKQKTESAKGSDQNGNSLPADHNRGLQGRVARVHQSPTRSPRNLARHAVRGESVKQRVGKPVTQPVNKSSWVTQQKVNGMVIKLPNKNKATLTPEGLYPATIKASSVKNKKGTEVPGSVIVEFALNGRTESLLKEYPHSLEEGSPLLQDTYTVLGRCLAPEEVSDGFDPGRVEGSRVPGGGRTSGWRQRLLHAVCECRHGCGANAHALNQTKSLPSGHSGRQGT